MLASRGQSGVRATACHEAVKVESTIKQPSQPIPGPAGPTARLSLDRPSGAIGTTGLASAHSGHRPASGGSRSGGWTADVATGLSSQSWPPQASRVRVTAPRSRLIFSTLLGSLVARSCVMAAPGYTFFPHHPTVPFLTREVDCPPRSCASFYSCVALLSPILAWFLFAIGACRWTTFESDWCFSFYPILDGSGFVVVPAYCSFVIILPPEGQLKPVTNPTGLSHSPQPATTSLIPSRHLEGF